ncbi:MAG: DUF3291 domain-containing protein, partial [Acidimicrobiia bacterium]|nr:DUF3291 domain-containing protein [Acidimicrobiia bacterium]
VAQVNVGRLRAPVDDPLIADFVAGLDQINAVADAAPGFVWRLQTEDGNATAIRPDAHDALLAINMLVWRSVEALADYVYRSDHVGFMRRRREWFDRFDRHYLALWWIPAGTVPTVDEAMDRLARLDQHGPTEHAFTFRHRFDPPSLGGGATTGGDHRRDACPA